MNDLTDQFLRLEQSLMYYRKSDVEKLLSHDFKEFGSSGGEMDKACQLKGATNAGLEEIPFFITHFEATQLAENIVMTTYQTENKKTCVKANRSSIWRKEQDYWRLFFHQGTPTK